MNVLGVKVIVVLWLSVADAIRVQTTLGELDGNSFITNSQREIFTFLGIPFAKPPVGKYRFEEPKPAKPWTGIWPAKDFGSACIQLDSLAIFGAPGGIVGSEDCLYLNIYTPSVSNSSNLPVLVYFHGGAFMFGESDIYNPKFLIEKHDIVYVSANYRLGPFGFLSTQDDVVPGNSGLKDQVLALRWVQENIAAFGGNVNKVTISGNSAGGASVHYHYLSPLSQGLFDKGISSSGSALNPWAFTEASLEKTKLLADSITCPTNTTDAMVRCLKHRPSKQILSKVQLLFMPWYASPFSPFGPVVENTTRTAFLSEHPYQLLKNSQVYDRPWLASDTAEEGLFPGALFIDRPELLQLLNDEWNAIAPHLLDFNHTVPPDKVTSVNKEVKTFYFGSENISEKTQGKVIEMLSDRLFSAGLGMTARLQASVTTSPVFFYTFSYRGKVSLSNLFTKTKAYFGVSHFDDMIYIMTLPESFKLKVEEDDPMIQTMINIWASFIETGTPSPTKGVKWDPVPQDATITEILTHLLISSSNKTVLTKTDNHGNFKFWNSLQLNENTAQSDVVIEIKDEL